MTAAELVAELDADPAFQAMSAQKAASRAEMEGQVLEEQAPLRTALAEVGVTVSSVWDLVNRAEPYHAAIPVLLEHLAHPYSDRTREGIGRALAVPEAAHAWDELLQRFRQNPDPSDKGWKWGVGCALAAIAGETERYEEARSILRDRSLGQSRAALLPVLSMSKDSAVQQWQREFVDDPELGEQARWNLANPGRQRG